MLEAVQTSRRTGRSGSASLSDHWSAIDADDAFDSRRTASDTPQITISEVATSSICSRDGHLRALECRMPAQNGYRPPESSHVVAMMLEPASEMETWMPGEGRRSHDLRRGDLIIVPAGQPLHVNCKRPNRLLIMLVHPRVVCEAAIDDAASGTHLLTACSGVKDPFLRCIAEALTAEGHRSFDEVSPLLDSAGAAFGAHLLSHYVNLSEAAPGCLGKRELNLVSEHIRSRIGNSFRLEELAGITGYSVCHFSHLFKAATGRSPMRYVLECKMRRARELIETTRMTLTEVGLSLGYSDSAHFSRTFKAYWRMKPSAIERPSRANAL